MARIIEVGLVTFYIVACSAIPSVTPKDQASIYQESARHMDRIPNALKSHHEEIMNQLNAIQTQLRTITNQYKGTAR